MQHGNSTLGGGSFRQRVRDREVLLGTFLQLGSSMATEMIGDVGFDWVLVDLEHGAASEATLAAHLQALRGGPAAIVRVESGERLRVGRALDAGAVGVMVPRIDSAAQAAEVVRWLRYPPEGARGVALGTRAAGYGRVALAEISRLNQQVVGIIQIESRRSVESVEAIAAVDGVDVLFVGPADLSVDLGIPGQLEHPDFVGALRRICEAADKHGKAVGTLLRSANDIRAALERGITFLGIGSDGTVLASGMRALLRDAHAALPPRP